MLPNTLSLSLSAQNALKTKIPKVNYSIVADFDSRLSRNSPADFRYFLSRFFKASADRVAKIAKGRKSHPVKSGITKVETTSIM